MNIVYKCTPPDGLKEVLKNIETFQRLAKHGWYADELEEMGRILFKSLGKCFDIRPPAAKVDWGKLTNRRGVADDC